MHTRHFLISKVLVFLFSMLSVQAQSDKDPWIQELNSLLAVMSEERLHQELAPAAVYANKMRLSSKTHPEVTPGSALRLWVVGEHDFLITTWYRDTSRAKRALLCALFICNKIESLRDPVDGRRTDFELGPMRFAEPEAKERLEELEYVKKNAPALARQFLPVLSKVLPAERLEGMAYTAKLTAVQHEQLLQDAQTELDREIKSGQK